MGKLSGAQVGKLDSLDQAKRKWDRVHKLVELAAVSPKSADDLMRQCHRTASEVGRFLSSNAFGPLCDQYADLKMGLVDRVVIGVAERLEATAIVTFDLRHFGVVVIEGRPLLLPRDL